MPATTDIDAREDELQRFLAQELSKELLRFTTAGSVDDGKSTLIGRLLHDAKAVYEDQLDSVKKSRINRSGKAIDFSLLTDGLRAEREQGITIDVAYRYFSTARRKFIIADTPGHEQYTRNMATGASTAGLAVILIDATKGLLSQTRRHAYIASLLGISHVLAAVNKMDLVDYSEDIFSQLRSDCSELARQLRIPYVQCIPISALDGDNIVVRSDKTPWYRGPTLLEHLETVKIQPGVPMDALRFPVQSVFRPDANFRGFAGRVAAGTVRPGDKVLALPSKQRAKVASIVTFDGNLHEAGPSQSVVLTLTEEIDLSRGDMIVSPVEPPHISSRFAAMIVWLHEKPLQPMQNYLLKHAGRIVKARATRIRTRTDVNQLTEHSANEVEMNGIAFVEFETNTPLFFDSYLHNRTTGSFILIDPSSNATVGAAMIREDLSHNDASPKHASGPVTIDERHERHGHRSAIFSVTGDSNFAQLLERALFAKGFEVILAKAEEVPVAVLPILLSALWPAGFVIVYSSTSPSLEERFVLKRVAQDRLFPVASSEPAHTEQEILEQALATAETLRVVCAAADERKVDSDVFRH
jgi:bifunctional enzyme CysN/CysC/sulfate adenylyltransferase subunit 1